MVIMPGIKESCKSNDKSGKKRWNAAMPVTRPHRRRSILPAFGGVIAKTRGLHLYSANTVAVVSDGSAVLGLGNIGEGPMPVMER